MDAALVRIDTLSLHVALPISHGHSAERRSIFLRNGFERAVQPAVFRGLQARRAGFHEVLRVEVRACEIGRARRVRSEEHTSELQSRLHLVCRLLLEKKKE